MANRHHGSLLTDEDRARINKDSDERRAEFAETINLMVNDAIRKAVLAERTACAQLAWQLQALKPLGGTDIGDAIKARVDDKGA